MQEPPPAEEVAVLRLQLAEAERRAAELAAELDALRSGLGWKALASYRQVARKVAPAGSRRGEVYDLVVGTARRSSARLRNGAPEPEPATNGWTAAEVPRSDPAPQEADVSEVGPPGADTWFRDHYDEAAGKVIAFLAMDGIALEGMQVADIGAGDGSLDLGLVHKGRPARLVAFDVNQFQPDALLQSARREGVCDALPDALEFRVCGPTNLPAEARSFDVVVTWSAFEHIAEPLAVLREMRRVVRDDGVLFLQVWPFYHSQFGSHLRDWFPEGWEHLQRSPEQIEAVVRTSDLHPPSWADVMLDEFSELNKVTVDDLGAALVEAGFAVRRLNLLTRNVPVPVEAASRIPLSWLGIEGVELTAVPRAE